jgi:hypothetical protein
MQLLLVKAEDAVGESRLDLFHATGPTSYDATNGDAVTAPPFTYLRALPGTANTVSGTYYVRFFPSASNTLRATWTARWYAVSGNAQVNNAVNLSAESIQLSAVVGEF